MTKQYNLTAILISLLSGISGHAADPANAKGKYLFNADILSTFCNSPHGAPYDDGICAGYITGIADAMLREPGMQKSLCVVRNLSTTDFSTLVTRHLAKHPDDTGQPAADVIRAALLTAFACDKH